jgi:hypothetical protein
MSRGLHVALWTSAATLATVALAWMHSWVGMGFLSVTGAWRVSPLRLLPDTPWRDGLLGPQAFGLVLAFVLALLLVRFRIAPPLLWVGSLAASVILALPYTLDLLVLWLTPAIPVRGETSSAILWSAPFLDPYIALLALLGYPLIVGLGCWLGSLWLARHAAAQHQESVAHA